jgi:hypothetical protein
VLPALVSRAERRELLPVSAEAQIELAAGPIADESKDSRRAAACEHNAPVCLDEGGAGFVVLATAEVGLQLPVLAECRVETSTELVAGKREVTSARAYCGTCCDDLAVGLECKAEELVCVRKARTKDSVAAEDVSRVPSAL